MAEVQKTSAFRTPGEGASAAISVATIAVLFLLWWAITAAGLIKPLFLPSPQAVAQQFMEYINGTANDKPLWQHLAASLLRVAAAFVLAVLTAVPNGIAIGMSRVARGIFDPPIEFYRPLPPLAYLPLIIIWFGIDELPKVLLIFLACFAPLALAARSGMKSAAQEQINAAYSMGASYTQVVQHVVLPAALPEILVGINRQVWVNLLLNGLCCIWWIFWCAVSYEERIFHLVSLQCCSVVECVATGIRNIEGAAVSKWLLHRTCSI